MKPRVADRRLDFPDRRGKVRRRLERVERAEAIVRAIVEKARKRP